MFFIYSLKVAVCLIAFYLVYKLLLSRDSFYRFNHALLLTLMFASLVVPTIRLTLADEAVLNKGIVMVEEAVIVGEALPIVETGRGLSVVQMLFLIYIIGVAVLLLMNVVSVWHIVRLMKRVSMRQTVDGMEVMVVEENVSPFSWFGNVVMSRKDYETGFAEILIHEREHARLGHSYEVMLCNLLIIFQWYNPAAWLLKRELQDIHEYEADAAVLREGVDPKQYQMLLIVKSVGERAFLLANNLNHNSLKKRIKMMKTTKTNRWQCLKALAVLPVAACAVVAFANPTVEKTSREIETSVKETLAVAEIAKSESPVLQLKEKSNLASQNETSSLQPKGKDEKVYDVVDEMPSYPGGMEAMFKFLQMNVCYPEVAQKNEIEGRVVVNFVIDKEGNVMEPKIVNSVSPDLDNEALRVVTAMPKWKPGMLKGKPVAVQFTIPIEFRLQGEDGDKAQKNVGVMEDNNMAYFVDGKTVDLETVKAIDPSTIASVNVLKNKASLEKFGVKDKSGAVLVELKKK
ncbi:MAG: TonB family protein [Prevotella sp.]